MPATAGSGRISVSTPAGTGVSAADFFVPPSPYTAASVAHTGRMQPGDTSAVTLGTANKIGLVVFDVAQGQRAGLKVTGSTIGVCKVSILNPDRTDASWMTVSTSGGFLDTSNLNMQG